jgi:hypothetical protein
MYHVVMNNVFRRQLLSQASAIFLCHATSAHQLEDLFIEGLGDPARVGEIFPRYRCNREGDGLLQGREPPCSLLRVCGCAECWVTGGAHDSFESPLWADFLQLMPAILKLSSVYELTPWILAHAVMYIERTIAFKAGQRSNVMALKEDWMPASAPYYQQLLAVGIN